MIEEGQTVAEPLMEQAGAPATAKTTSSCSVQPAKSVTVKRKIAVAAAPLTCAVAGKVVQLVQEDGASREAPAVDETTLHAMDAMGYSDNFDTVGDISAREFHTRLARMDTGIQSASSLLNKIKGK